MQWDQVIATLNGRDISLAEIALAGAALMFLLLIAAVVLAWRAQRVRREEALDAIRRSGELELRVAELSGHLRSLADQALSSQAQLARTLDERLDHVSLRLGRGLSDQAERTHASLRQLHERLAVIDAAQAN